MNMRFRAFIIFGLFVFSARTVAYNVGLCVTATKKYTVFLGPLLDSARKFFLKNHQVTYFVFSDQMLDLGPDVIVVPIEHRDWPFSTMMRFDYYYAARERFANIDYVYALDADMLFVGDVGDELLSDLVGTQHPHFITRIRKSYPYEPNTNSRAYIAPHEGTYYLAGGFYGGSNMNFFKLVGSIPLAVQDDLGRGIIAINNDESHLNRYFVDNPPTKVLSASYCYPEDEFHDIERKILALAKNHTFMRE